MKNTLFSRVFCVLFALSELRSSQLSYTRGCLGKQKSQTDIGLALSAQDERIGASPCLPGLDRNQSHEHLTARENPAIGQSEL
jgi:hypothetical protein